MGWEACQTVSGEKQRCHISRQWGNVYCYPETHTSEVCVDFDKSPSTEEASAALGDQARRQFRRITYRSPVVVSRTYSWAEMLARSFLFNEKITP